MTDHEILLGQFAQDKSGLWHYGTYPDADKYEAAKDALSSRPEGSVCWFWFDGTFAPIEPRDTAEMLVERWQDWRNAYVRDPSMTIILLELYSNLQ